jgi:hypothetical protein
MVLMCHLKIDGCSCKKTEKEFKKIILWLIVSRKNESDRFVTFIETKMKKNILLRFLNTDT